MDAHPLSDFDVLKHVRLPNWGRAGRVDSGRPDPEAISGFVYELGPDDLSERDETPTALPPVIDHEDADRLDFWIRQMPEHHKQVLRRRYYLRLEDARSLPSRLDVDAAVRSLVDTMEANVCVLYAMRRLTRWPA